MNIKLTISADGYQAHLSLKPAGSTKELGFADLMKLLQDRGVVYGFKKEVMAIVLVKYNQGHDIENILVAEGVTPFQGVEPAVEYKFQISSKPKMDESGKVDYREISKILNITKGQLLAVKRRMKQPRNGITVTGKKTTFTPILDIPVQVGGNVDKIEEEDYTYYKAACDGALVFENQVLTVFPTLDIQQDVDFNAGNIHFKGDVKIGRDVLPDFIVEATGSIFLWGSAIACQLKAGDSVEVRAGIVGKNKGWVQAGTFISATFVENASLKCPGDIKVKNGIIGSKVHSDGKVTVDMKRSRVVGSTVRGARGIEICNAGSRFDTGTILITGINPNIESDYFKIKNTLESKWTEARELEKRYGREALDKRNFSQTVSQAIHRDLEKWDFLKKQIKNIIQHLKKAEEEMYNYDAIIRIKETLYPRVTLKIGKHSLTTVKEYFSATVRYSPEDAKLVID